MSNDCHNTLVVNGDVSEQAPTNGSVNEHAFIVDGFVVAGNGKSGNDLSFGDVVTLDFVSPYPGVRSGGSTVIVQRLALVLGVEKKKSGKFEGLVLPCPHLGPGAPTDRQSFDFPKQCATKVSSAKDVVDLLKKIHGYSGDSDLNDALADYCPF